LDLQIKKRELNSVKEKRPFYPSTPLNSERTPHSGKKERATAFRRRVPKSVEEKGKVAVTFGGAGIGGLRR